MLILCAGVGTGCRSRGQERFDLPKRPAAGRYVVTVTRRTDHLIQADRREQPRQRLFQTAVAEVEVSPPSGDDLQQVRIGFQRLAWKVEVGEHVRRFDSADPAAGADPELAAVAAAVLQARLSATLAPDGEVRDIRGAEALWTALARANPPAGALLEEMKRTLAADLVRDVLGGCSRLLPDHPVAVGETWTVQERMNLPFAGPCVVRSECRLEDVQPSPRGRLAVIAVTGKVRSEKATATSLGASTLTVLAMDMKQYGRVRLSLKTGRVVAYELVQVGPLMFSARRPGGQESQTNVQQRQTLKITMLRADRAPG